MRTQSKVKEFKECEDYISDMFLMPGSNTLLATRSLVCCPVCCCVPILTHVCGSGDGSLSAYDVAAKSMLAVSDYMEEELLSLCPIKALIVETLSLSNACSTLISFLYRIKARWFVGPKMVCSVSSLMACGRTARTVCQDTQIQLRQL